MAGNCESWTIFWLSIVAFAFAITSVAQCRFALIVIDGFDYSDWPGFGLFSFDDGDTCQSYPDEVKDEVFEAQEKVARAFGVITCLLTGFSMVMVMTVKLFLGVPKISKILWKCVKVFYGLSVVSQIATFAMLASDACINPTDVGFFGTEEYCVPGPAGIVAALNVILLLVVSCIACGTDAPKPVHSLCKPAKKESSSTATEERGDEEEGIEVPYNSSDNSGDSNYQTEPMDVAQNYTSGAAVEVPYQPSTWSKVGAAAASTVTTISIGKDGSKKTTKTVTNPDGSKTTTVTIEKGS